MKKIFTWILLFPFLANAQPIITLKNVIDTTLKNSFDIQIAENNFQIAKNNNRYGVAGGLPVISAGVSDNASLNSIEQKFSSGTDTNLDNIFGNSVNGNISASILLFNGLRITATKERLSLLQKQNEYILNQQIQSAIASVTIKYYDIIRQQFYLKIMEQLQEVSEKKLEIINVKKDVGMADGVDILQANMDLNTAKENHKLQQLVIEQSKADLLLLMSAKSFYTFAINDSISFEPVILRDSVISSLSRNPQYLIAMQQVQIEKQVVREVSAQPYPSVRLNTSYNFARADNSSGLTLMNQMYGPSADLSIQIPIYNGGAYKAQRQAAILNFYNSELQKQSMINSLQNNAYKTYQAYSTYLSQIAEQEKNYEMAKQLMEIVLQNFQLNQATILDVKAAHATYENAGYLLINIQYAAKVAEIELLLMMYKLK